MSIEVLSEKLDQGRKDLNASSCTFYLRDPHWPEEFRLVAISGVLIKEPMYGFVSPVSARKVVVEGELEIFSTDADTDKRFRDPLLSIDDIPESLQPLFGDFSQREGVQSSVRLIYRNDVGEREGILFINFSSKTQFDETLKSRIHSFFAELVSDTSRIYQDLRERDAEWLSEAMSIVSPTWTVAQTDFYALDKPDNYFSLVIESVLNSLHITPGTGLGTIHLYNEEEHMLELHGSFGKIQHAHRAQKQEVKSGQGIVSWVALRKRALLIQDLEKSDFNRIHVWLNDDVKSELAVPLEAEGELIGVMCLECTEVNKFLPHHVRSLWYAANKAAVAYLLHQHASMNRKLLKLCWQATVGEFEAHTSLKDVASLAKDYLKASFCDIWRYNADAKRFDIWGASYEGNFPPFRQGGWTDCVQRMKLPIWIGNIKSVSEYTIHHWMHGEWHEGVPDQAYPTELNRIPIDQGVRSALGIPITIRDDCVGVAWIKYRRAGLECLKAGPMSLALGFAAEAGLVLDSIERREVDMKEKLRINHVGKQIANAIQSRSEVDCYNIIDTHVISISFHSNLGGDFYARKLIDSNTVGVLLVDGEGHGVEGSLHMLPLMTAFESFWQSYSAAHVISQLIKTSEAVGVRGSAIYCIISLIDRKRWLCVTSAGHESLIVFKKEERGKWSFQYYPKSYGPMLGSPLKEPLMDHRLELSAGDVIVGYTDGVAEQNLDFDATRLATFVLNYLIEKGDDPERIAEAIIQKSHEQYLEGYQDDATVFVIRVK